jgi:hypothetical protein
VSTDNLYFDNTTKRRPGETDRLEASGTAPCAVIERTDGCGEKANVAAGWRLDWAVRLGRG